MSKTKKKSDLISSRSVELKFGYENRETPDFKHQLVVFGKRPTGGDFIHAADNSADSEIQFALELIQAAITQFGKLEMPVPLTVLLSLNQIDREILMRNYFTFLVDSIADEGEILENGKARLAIGIGSNLSKTVEFGRLLSGYDEIEIERAAKSEWQSNALRMARHIITPENVTLADIESLDVDDFTLLRNAEEEWLNSFRNS